MPPWCRRLPTTPSCFLLPCCIFNSHSIILLPLLPLHPSLIPLLIHIFARADGDCEARWPIQETQSVSCCISIQEERTNRFQFLLLTCAELQLVLRKYKSLELLELKAWQTEGDGGVIVEELISSDALFYRLAWLRGTTMQANERIKFSPLQTCLSLSLCSVVWGMVCGVLFQSTVTFNCRKLILLGIISAIVCQWHQ